MSPRVQSAKTLAQTRLRFNVDAAAILLAITLTLLIRLNIIHHVAW
jgi:hypothetical protein